MHRDIVFFEVFVPRVNHDVDISNLLLKFRCLVASNVDI
jgi:hypothetical protein